MTIFELANLILKGQGCRRSCRSCGARTLLIVPMLEQSKLVGTISIYRREVAAVH